MPVLPRLLNRQGRVRSLSVLVLGAMLCAIGLDHDALAATTVAPAPRPAALATEATSPTSLKQSTAASSTPAGASVPLAHAPSYDSLGSPGMSEELEGTTLGSSITTMVRLLLALGAILLLAYLLLHRGLGSLSRRLAKGRLVRVVDRVGLEPKKSLYVIEVADQYYLIGTSDNGISCLATLSPDQQRGTFARALRGAPIDDQSDTTKPPIQGEQNG